MIGFTDLPLPQRPMPKFDAAVCRTRPDLPWFGGGRPEAQREALALCARCPELDACHAWADEHGEDGIWGGLTQGQRHAMRAARRRCTSRL